MAFNSRQNNEEHLEKRAGHVREVELRDCTRDVDESFDTTHLEGFEGDLRERLGEAERRRSRHALTGAENSGNRSGRDKVS